MLFTLFLHIIALPAALQTVANLDRIDGIGYVQDMRSPQRIYDDQLGVALSAKNWLVLDEETGKELYSFNADNPTPIASITKLMTALVFLDTNPDLKSKIVVEERDRVGGSSRRLNPGERVTINDVLHTALIPSDNDAAQLLQRISGMTEEEFVRRMNAKAAQYKMYRSVFKEPTGLNPGNMSTARDIITLLRYALENPIIADIIQKPAYSFTVTEGGIEREVKLYSTDHLQGSVYAVVGGKTGYIEEAGYCLVVKVIGRGGHPYFIAVLGSGTVDDRFQDVKMLSEWVDRHYIWNK